MKYDPTVKPETFVSKDATRPHMTRVQLDADAQKLVATDGHRMIVTPIADCADDHSGPIDAAVLVAARKSARKSEPTLAANGCIKLPDGTTYVRPGDASDFPPWQRVMPKDDSDVKAKVGVNAKYLASIFAAVGDRQVTMLVRGELDPIEFRVQGDLGETIILVMPMRM